MTRILSTCLRLPNQVKNRVTSFMKGKFMRVAYMRSNVDFKDRPHALPKVIGVYSANYCTQEAHKLTITNSHPGLLEASFLGVETYGKLNVDVPFDIHVEPLNLDKFPEMNKLLIRLVYIDAEKENIDSDALAALRHLYSFSVDVQSKNQVSVKGKFKSKMEFPLLCHFQVPMKFDLDINAGGKRTTIQKLESGSVTVKAKSATSLSNTSSCTVSKLKCGFVKVECENGDIVSEKLLQGNLDLKVIGEGNISTERLQGTDIKCETDKGNISATSVYGQNCSFHGNHGNIKLTNCHGQSDIRLGKGNLTLDAVEGNLSAEIDKGSVELYITRPEDIKVKVNSGDITLKVLDEVKANLDLSGTSVDLDEKLQLHEEQRTEGNLCHVKGHLSGTGGKIKAEAAQGKVCVKAQDWFSSLNIQTTTD